LAPQRKIIVDILRVYYAAVSQRDSHLFAEEFSVAEYPEEPVVKMVFLYRKPGERFAFYYVLFDNFRNVSGCNVAINRIARINHYYRAFVAHAQTAGKIDANIIRKIVVFKLLLQGLADCSIAFLNTARSIAYRNYVFLAHF
jgi:hypothetical protein